MWERRKEKELLHSAYFYFWLLYRPFTQNSETAVTTVTNVYLCSPPGKSHRNGLVTTVTNVYLCPPPGKNHRNRLLLLLLLLFTCAPRHVKVTETDYCTFVKLCRTGDSVSGGPYSALMCAVSVTISTLLLLLLLLKCCFTSTETVSLLGTGAQDVHLDFHTAPELWDQHG